MVRHVRCLKDAVKPILWLNCVFCMGVFEIPLNRPRFIFSMIYVTTIMIGYFVLLYKGVVIFEETLDCNLVLFYCVVIVNVSVATLAIISFWRKSQNFSKLLKRMGNADDTLEALGIRKNYRKTASDVLWGLVVWIACMLLLNIMHMVWMWRDNGYLNNIYTAMCFGFPIMINSVVDITFCSLVRCVRSKFRYTNILMNDVVVSANDGALKMHNEPKNTPVSIVRSNYRNDKDMIKHLVQTIQQLHLELTRIARDINGTYCFQLLLEMAVHFTIVTAVSYSLYSAFAGTSRSPVRHEKIVAMVVWATVYSVKIIIMNNLCTTAAHEVSA